MTTELPEGAVDRLVGLYVKCETVAKILPRMSWESVQSDLFHQLALSKAIELIGENAAGLLRKYPELDRLYPQLQLRKAVGMRNLLVHGYETISFEQLWDVATVSVPELQRTLEPILIDAGEDLS